MFMEIMELMINFNFYCLCKTPITAGIYFRVINAKPYIILRMFLVTLFAILVG